MGSRGLLALGSLNLLLSCDPNLNQQLPTASDYASSSDSGLFEIMEDSEIVTPSFSPESGSSIEGSAEDTSNYFTEWNFALQPFSPGRMQKLHQVLPSLDSRSPCLDEERDLVYSSERFEVYQATFSGNHSLAIQDNATDQCHFQDYAAGAFDLRGVAVSEREDGSLMLTALLDYNYLCERDDPRWNDYCSSGNVPFKVQQFPLEDYLAHPVSGSSEASEVGSGEHYPWHVVVSSAYFDDGSLSREEVDVNLQTLGELTYHSGLTGFASASLDSFSSSSASGTVYFPSNWNLDDFPVGEEVNLYLEADGKPTGLRIDLEDRR